MLKAQACLVDDDNLDGDVGQLGRDLVAMRHAEAQQVGCLARAGERRLLGIETQRQLALLGQKAPQQEDEAARGLGAVRGRHGRHVRSGQQRLQSLLAKASPLAHRITPCRGRDGLAVARVALVALVAHVALIAHGTLNALAGPAAL